MVMPKEGNAWSYATRDCALKKIGNDIWRRVLSTLWKEVQIGAK